MKKQVFEIYRNECDCEEEYGCPDCEWSLVWQGEAQDEYVAMDTYCSQPGVFTSWLDSYKIIELAN